MNILYLEFPENFNGKIKRNIGNKSITGKPNQTLPS